MTSSGTLGRFLLSTVTASALVNSDRKSFEIFLGLDVPWWEKGCFAAP